MKGTDGIDNVHVVPEVFTMLFSHLRIAYFFRCIITKSGRTKLEFEKLLS